MIQRMKSYLHKLRSIFVPKSQQWQEEKIVNIKVTTDFFFPTTSDHKKGTNLYKPKKKKGIDESRLVGLWVCLEAHSADVTSRQGIADTAEGQNDITRSRMGKR